MTNRDKYIRLCEQHQLPLHAQAWWWEAVTAGHGWDALTVESEDGAVWAAMPYTVVSRLGMRAVLMPVHTQYHCIYIAEKAPDDIYQRVAEALETTYRSRHAGWVQLQGFYPAPLCEALRERGFSIREKITYRIDAIPPRDRLTALFSENKKRQLRKATGMQLAELSVEEFYAFHQDCMSRQGKKIDYSYQWAQALLPVAIQKGHGRLLGARNADGQLAAALFLAWDDRQAYYLLPSYDPDYKNSGAMAWLTTEVLAIAQEKGLQFDFEGSMTPSIASSYQQFGGEAKSYHSIEKFYNPIYRIAVWIRQHI